MIVEIIVRLQNKAQQQPNVNKLKRKAKIAMPVAPRPNLNGPFVAHMTEAQCKELRVGSKFDAR